MLVAALSPTLGAVASASTDSALTALAEGAASLLEGVVPGMNVTFSFGPVAQGTTLRLGGPWVNGSAGGMVVHVRSEDRLRPATLVPGRAYVARIAGGVLVVTLAV